MAIFKKRPLAAASVVLILGVIAAYPLSLLQTAILTLPVLLAFLALVIFCAFRGFSYRRFFALLVLFALLVGAERTLLYRRQTEGYLDGYTESVVSAEFKIEDIEYRSTYGSRLIVRLTELDGKACRARVLWVCEGMTPFYIGDRVRGEFFCDSPEKHSFYEGQESRYLADGISAAFTTCEDTVPVLTEDGNRSVGTVLRDLRGALQYAITSAVDGEEGRLIGAMLLGTKDQLEDSTVLQFRRVGLSHLLALSGLHLAILAGAAELLLRACRLGRRCRLSILLAAMLAYWVLTGCSVSMLRAVLMFTVLQAAFVARADYDAFTALCACGALMVLITPSVIFDTSFQMTMLATLGILAFGELQARLVSGLPRAKSGPGRLGVRLLRYLIGSVFITFAASLAILPVQWLIFGEVSLLTPFANLLILPLSTALLWLAVPLAAVSFIPSLAAVVGVPAGYIARAILELTKPLADLRGMLSLQYDFVPFILIPLLVATALLLVLDLKRLRALTLAPAAIGVAAFAVALLITNHTGAQRLEAVYRTTGSNDGLLLIQNGTAMICDLSNGSNTQLYSDYSLLQAHCATEVEVLMLTHYHQRHPSAIAQFSGQVTLRQLWVPEPLSDSDKVILADILGVAVEKEITVTVYRHGGSLTAFEKGSVTLYTPLREARSVEPCLTLRVSFGNGDLVYQSAAHSEYERGLGISSPVTETDHLILGGHGPNPHESISPTVMAEPQGVVISSKDHLPLYTLPWQGVSAWEEGAVTLVLE